MDQTFNQGKICLYYSFALSYDFSPTESRHTLRVDFSPYPPKVT